MTYFAIFHILFDSLNSEKQVIFFILSLNTENVFTMCDVFDYSYKKFKFKI